MLSTRLLGIAIILGSTVFEAAGQLAFKRAADSPAVASQGLFIGSLANFRWVLLGWLCFICEGLFWSAALYFLDVSVAHPIGSLVFVVVAVFARVFLGEHLSIRRWAGIVLILAGSILVAFN